MLEIFLEERFNFTTFVSKGQTGDDFPIHPAFFIFNDTLDATNRPTTDCLNIMQKCTRNQM